MSRLVVDASVAVKWYVPEIHSEYAEFLLTDEVSLYAPDLLFSEVGNILWKRVMRHEMTEDKARTIMHALEAAPINIQPASSLAEAALTIACRVRRSFYDSLYIALAVAADGRLVTADLKLYHALKDVPLLKRHFLWVEDVHNVI